MVGRVALVVGLLLIIAINAVLVEKTKAAGAAQKASHAAREKLRRERREEQEWNTQQKKAVLAGKMK